MRLLTFSSFRFAVAASFAVAQSQPNIKNPYSEYYATVVRIIDADTLEVRLDLWPGIFAEYAVRARD